VGGGNEDAQAPDKIATGPQTREGGEKGDANPVYNMKKMKKEAPQLYVVVRDFPPGGAQVRKADGIVEMERRAKMGVPGIIENDRKRNEMPGP